MSQPNRFAPPTHLDALRSLLSDYSEGDRTFEGQLHRSLQILGQQALPTLGRRLSLPTTLRSLRSLILKTAIRFDWPEWDLHLMQMLQVEDDLALFDEGCTALGNLCTTRALAGLRRLQEVRRDPERQEMLLREIEPYEAAHLMELCLGAVLKGAENPILARHGARALLPVVNAEHIPALLETYRQGGALSRHLILQVLTFHPEPALQLVLVDLFKEAMDDVQDGAELGEFLPKLKGIARESLRGILLNKLGERFISRAPGIRSPEFLTALRTAMADPSHSPTAELDLVRTQTLGPLEGFVATALGLLAEGKTMGLTALMTHAAESLPTLQEGANSALDDVAGHLAAKIEAGQLPLEEILPIFEAAFNAGMGGEGLLISYLNLVPIDERPRLDRFLEEPDSEQRKRIIEVLGAREDDKLVPFFFKAINDPIREVGLTAIHQLGKLPSGFEAMMNLFRSGKLDRMREAIHFFGENQTKAAAKPLMGFLSSESPDDLLVDAAHALGNICDPAAANALLNQLHSGKPLTLQLALAEALMRLATPAASLGLLKKAEVLIFPQVLILSLRGAMSAFPNFENPFPVEQLAALEHLADLCCDAREGAGQWMNAALTMQELHAFDKGVYVRLADKFTAFAAGMPHQSPRDRENHDRIHEVIKKLSRRAESLYRMEEREQLLQHQIEEYSNPAAPKRLLALDAMLEIITDPWLILSQAFSKNLVAFLREALSRAGSNLQESAILCQLAGLSGLIGLIDPLRDVYTHATNSELKVAAQKALLALGLTENEIERRAPIKSLLLLEPNAFFRKRLASTLEAKGRTIALAADRPEAEAILASTPVDLLITEMQDAEGDMSLWIETVWNKRLARYVLLSASNHNPGFLADKPWVIGRLYKPYPLEEILRAIEG